MYILSSTISVPSESLHYLQRKYIIRKRFDEASTWDEYDDGDFTGIIYFVRRTSIFRYFATNPCVRWVVTYGIARAGTNLTNCLSRSGDFSVQKYLNRCLQQAVGRQQQQD